MSNPLKVGSFVTVLGRPHFFYLDCDMTPTLPLKRFVEVFSHVTGPLLGVFWLVWRGGQNVTYVIFHAPTSHGLVGRYAIPTLNRVSHNQQSFSNPWIGWALSLKGQCHEIF